MNPRRFLQRVLAASMAAACLSAASVSALAIEIELPEEPMAVESTDGTRNLTTTAQRASSEIPLVLGIDVVGGNLFDGTLTMAGTDINDNPDPYIWNYNYLYPSNAVSGGTSYTGDRREGTEDFDGNAYYQIVSGGTSSQGMANGNGLYSSGGANQVMSTALEEYGGVSYGVYKQIDVWIGFNSDVLDQIDFVKNEMDKTSDYYQEGYADYNPLITDVSTGTVTSRAYSWVEMGNALSDYLEEHPDLSVRYGDPLALCYNIQEFAFGIPYYIDSLISSGKLTKMTGAYISSTTDDGLTFTLSDPADLGDVRADCYAVGNTVNWITGTYTMADLKAIDGLGVIVIGAAGYGYTGTTQAGAGGSTLTRAYVEGLMEEVGYTADNAPIVIDAANESVIPGTNGYNYSPITPLFVPYITAYMYMEQLQELADSGDTVAAAVNPTALVEYMFDEFFHIKDDSAYTISTYYIDTKWDATDSALDKVPAVASGDYVYNKDLIVSAIQTGIQYALNNQSNTSVYLNGAYREGETGYTLAQLVVSSGVSSFADILNSATDYTSVGSGSSAVDVSALVAYYGTDGLAELVDDYVAHMNAHAWNPDTSIVGTYGYGLSGNGSGYVGSFTDVPSDSYYAEAVSWAVDRSITTGTTATTFSPADTCTRGQIITFLWRAEGSPEPETDNTFTDVGSGDYYYKAVQWARENGIDESVGTFSPNAPCTRAMVVEYLWKLAGSPAASADAGFTDVASSNAYAAAVAWAVENGVTTGTSETTFSPSDTCTRAQIVTFLCRADGI
ncbi:MAG: S-layer homology domain-containing protein [Oscillospiraceae bacterium]|nr:S-layer homology domain-containing protein [Oscillospiraceae bacterium]